MSNMQRPVSDRLDPAVRAALDALANACDHTFDDGTCLWCGVAR